MTLLLTFIQKAMDRESLFYLVLPERSSQKNPVT